MSRPGVYAVGDAAAITSPLAGPLRMACATALPTASHAASAIIAEARGGEPKPLAFRYVLQCVSLGRRDGLVQFVRADDTPRDLVLRGATAARVKEQVVRSTLRVLQPAARRPDAVGHLPGMLMGDQNG
ncbi:hypothetical protein [Streptomyces sp. NPDC021212]|uniref:hypothetical protein n=1 Tax=Streptomyces sp. NPDC021212 TaxID=3365118 RepID=UPI0037873A8B